MRGGVGEGSWTTKYDSIEPYSKPPPLPLLTNSGVFNGIISELLFSRFLFLFFFIWTGWGVGVEFFLSFNVASFYFVSYFTNDNDFGLQNFFFFPTPKWSRRRWGREWEFISECKFFVRATNIKYLTIFEYDRAECNFSSYVSFSFIFSCRRFLKGFKEINVWKGHPD